MFKMVKLNYDDFKRYFFNLFFQIVFEGSFSKLEWLFFKFKYIFTT